MKPLAEVADRHLAIFFRSAPPLTLHDATAWRTDGNSPVRIGRDGATVYFSDYVPRGHTLRRAGRDLRSLGNAVPVRLIDDPNPEVGKWIEAIWQASGGPLYGWYHGEEPTAGPKTLFVPFIGEVLSEDDGLTWWHRRELLRVPAGSADSSWQNGFFAGGYGDLCVVPDRNRAFLYLFFTSYLPVESAEGIVVARLSIAGGEPGPDLAWWSHEGWRPAGNGLPKPLWPVARGWRHADPDGYWGPAVHYNRALGGYVMLLNRTADGKSDLRQEGIYASVNPALDDPGGWSPPLRIVRGGGWYPQIVGLEDGCGDAEAGAVGRFFMAGFSAWEIGLSRPQGSTVAGEPLSPTAEDFERVFGRRRSPW